MNGPKPPALPAGAIPWAVVSVSRPARRRLAAAGMATVMTAFLLGACGAERPVLAPVAPDLRSGTTTTTTTAAPTSLLKPTTTAPQPILRRRAGPRTMHGLIATPVGDPVVHKSPRKSSASIPVPRKNSLGVQTVFAVVGDGTQPWIQVLLPTRPNGSVGWVPRSKVKITSTDFQIFVSLSRRRLVVREGLHTVMRVPIAIGTPTNPTPTGATFMTELIDTGNTAGTYGPFAFGLALHSNTLSEFAGGDGRVGVHGTNQPELIGKRVSHGCVRLTNENVRRLVDLRLALGTPVFIS